MQDLTAPPKKRNALIVPDSGTAGRTLANILNPINWPGMAVGGGGIHPGFNDVFQARKCRQSIRFTTGRGSWSMRYRSCWRTTSDAPGVPVSGETWAI